MRDESAPRGAGCARSSPRVAHAAPDDARTCVGLAGVSPPGCCGSNEARTCVGLTESPLGCCGSRGIRRWRERGCCGTTAWATWGIVRLRCPRTMSTQPRQPRTGQLGGRASWSRSRTSTKITSRRGGDHE
eukprot:1190277-Prorocentrum_minimum.AAC.12